MDELRARFEKRYRELMHDEYISDKEWAWKFYQASLADIELDMPEPFKLAKSSSTLTYYYQDEVDAVLSCAGIKVKE